MDDSDGLCTSHKLNKSWEEQETGGLFIWSWYENDAYGGAKETSISLGNTFGMELQTELTCRIQTRRNP